MARIIALQGCRHGIGCSHLVVNLAVILMQRGYRVGLFDTDPRGAGIRTLFGLDESPERNLQAYWWLSLKSDITTLTSDFREYQPALDKLGAGIYLPPIGGQFIPGGPQFQIFEERYGQVPAREMLDCLIRDLALDFLLIDNQPEIRDDNLIGLSLADIAVVMMQLDNYDFQQTAVLLEVIKQFETPKIWLVPTLILPTIDACSVTRKIEHTYHYPVAGVLHLSEEMIRLASAGVFCLHYPAHSLTQAMVAIAHQLENSTRLLSPSSAGSCSSPKPSTNGRLKQWCQQPRLNLLEFPNLERKVLTMVLRQGPIAMGPLIQQSGHSSNEVIMAIDHLMAQGWLIQDPTTQMVQYHTELPNRS